MLSFMFGVLGSLIFWAIYIPISFVISVTLMKRVIGPTIGVKLLSKDSCSIMKLLDMAALIVIMISWPAIIVFYILFKVILADVFLTLLTSMIEKAEKIVPKVEIKFSDTKKENRSEEV